MPLTVFVRDLEVYAYHGVPAEERVIGHRYRLSMDLDLSECGAVTSDLVSETVDYGAVAQLAGAVLRGSQAHTLERLVGEISDAIFAQFPTVSALRIELGKPMPPADVIVRELGVLYSACREGK